MIEVREEENTTLLIEGEAEVELVEGSAEVFGCPVRKLTLKHGILPLFLREDSIVRLRGKFIPVKGHTIPKSWKKLAKMEYRRIFLFGESDSGKSSLATYLVNKMSGRKWVVDTDIGQADIAHPAAMGVGLAEGNVVSMSQVEMIDGLFIGCTSPSGREARCIKGVKKLMKWVEGKEDRVIVDSTGWVKGRKARDYKLAKLEIIQPDVVACFGKPPYYLSDFNVFEVESFVLKRRSREARSTIRSKIYSEWLNDAEIRSFSIDEVQIKNTALFKGERIDTSLLQEIIDADILFAEKGFDFLNVCIDRELEVGLELIRALKEVYSTEDVCIFTPRQLEGLLVGLYSKRYLGIGVLRKLNIEEEKLEVLTPVKEDITRMEFGEIRLDESMKESLVRVP
jgi:polynucleotide 5'-hydroxyl-kinase GRC3/NOL9